MLFPWRLSTFILIISSIHDIAHAHSRSRNPLDYLALIENPTILTPSHRVHSSSSFDIIFNLHRRQQKIKLSLEPSHGIVAEGASVEYLDAAGSVTRTEPIDRREHRIFKGYTWLEQSDGSWTNVGWARISVRKDGIDPLFEGAFTVSHDHHHVQLRSSYMQTKHELDPILESSLDEHMVIFRDSDIGQPRHGELKRSLGDKSSCSAHQLVFNTDPSHPVFAPDLKRETSSWGAMPIHSLFGKRRIDSNPTSGNSGVINLSSTIGSTNGCPSTRKVALIGVATDCSYTASFSTADEARQNVITQINSASEVYENTFNITLGLQNLTVSDSNCPGSPPAAAPWNIGCSGNTTLTDRLNIFSQWRGERNDSNAFWTLLTRCSTGAEVGLAWLGQACVTDITQGQGETGINVAMGLLKRARIVTAGTLQAVPITSAATREPAGSGTMLSAMTPTRIAVEAVNLPRPGQYAEPARACAIRKKRVLVPMLLVHRTRPPRPVKAVETLCNVRVVSALLEICSARPSWAPSQRTMTRTHATVKTAPCLALLLHLVQGPVIGLLLVLVVSSFSPSSDVSFDGAGGLEKPRNQGQTEVRQCTRLGLNTPADGEAAEGPGSISRNHHRRHPLMLGTVAIPNRVLDMHEYLDNE
ncbi:MAG: hypothetical protein Q9187_000046 [Circinaria calcarea]